MRTPRILVVNGEPIVCEALAQLIARQSRLTVCGALTEGSKLIPTVERDKPDLVLLDLVLPGTDGIELIKQFKAMFPGVAVLVLCAQPECSHAERSLRAGAAGYVMKSETAVTLFDAIKNVLRGKRHLSQRMSALLLDKLLARARVSNGHDPSELTDRELAVFQLIGAGLRTREIAERLGRSVKTIKAHRENIKNKLNLRNGAEMAKRAHEWVSRAPASKP